MMEDLGSRRRDSQGAPRTSAAPKGSSIAKRIRGRSARQRCRLLKTTRGSSIANRILRTLHAPAPPPAENRERIVDHEQNSEDPLHAPAPRPGENCERVVNCEENSQDDPRASAINSGHQRSKTARGSSLVRVRKTFHAPARVRAENSERDRKLRPKFARRRKESYTTQAIPAEDWQTSFRIRAAPQLERCYAHEI